MRPSPEELSIAQLKSQVSALTKQNSALSKKLFTQTQRNDSLAEKQSNLNNTITELTTGTNNKGRNNTKKKNMTSYQKVNIDIIGEVLKEGFLPYNKFPHDSWKTYQGPFYDWIYKKLEWPPCVHV